MAQAEAFFDAEPGPATLARDVERVAAFLSEHKDKRVALVTSGGALVAVDHRSP